jgi:hypothetical protein
MCFGSGSALSSSKVMLVLLSGPPALGALGRDCCISVCEQQRGWERGPPDFSGMN